MTTAALMLLALLAGMVLVEFLIHRPDRKRQATQHAEIVALKDETIEHAQARADNNAHSRDLAERRAKLAEEFRADDIAELRGQLAAAQLDADCNATALRALLEHEARADLVNPDEPRGYAQTFVLGSVAENVTPIKRKAGKR